MTDKEAISVLKELMRAPEPWKISTEVAYHVALHIAIHRLQHPIEWWMRAADETS